MGNHGKRVFWRLGVGPEKWSSLPAALKVSTHDLTTELMAELERLANRAPRQLSSDAALSVTERRLNTALKRLRDDYADGRI